MEKNKTLMVVTIGRHDWYVWQRWLYPFFSLKHFGHLSHSCIKTCHNSVFSLFFQTFWPKWRNFFPVISKTFRSV